MRTSSKIGKEKNGGKGMSENKQYEKEYKVQAVKLAKKQGRQMQRKNSKYL